MLKKIALLVVMFALPLGAMAQTKFAHMNSQEVIVTMPEYTKAQADLDAMSKEYQTEMQRTQEEFNKKYQEFLAQADSLPKNIAERRQKELQDMAQRQEQFQQEILSLPEHFARFRQPSLAILPCDKYLYAQPKAKAQHINRQIIHTRQSRSS